MWLGSTRQHGCVYSIGRWYARVYLAQPFSGVGRDKFVVSVPPVSCLTCHLQTTQL